jgi:hypothetical protein
MYGAKGVLEAPGKPQGWEETGSVSSEIPGIGVSAKTSDFANHTYEMEADALKPVGHDGFVTDAETMAALLYDFSTRADYRSLVKKEFTSMKALYGKYQEALKKVYVTPKVEEPK